MFLKNISIPLGLVGFLWICGDITVSNVYFYILHHLLSVFISNNQYIRSSHEEVDSTGSIYSSIDQVSVPVRWSKLQSVILRVR